MASRDGRVPEAFLFTGNEGNWNRWKTKFHIYLQSSGKAEKTDEHKIYTLLNLLGDDGLDIWETFDMTATESTLEAVLEKFSTYCNPRKNEVFDRFCFFERVQGEQESIDTCHKSRHLDKVL